jgi:hypothetical protein
VNADSGSGKFNIKKIVQIRKRPTRKMWRGELTETCLAADQDSDGIAVNRIADTVWQETPVYDGVEIRVEKSKMGANASGKVGEDS